jgi:hypothetical protein
VPGYGLAVRSPGLGSTGFGQVCPCGSGTLYAACCGPLHRGVAWVYVDGDVG